MWRTNCYLPFLILEATWIGRDPQETGEMCFDRVQLQEYSKSVIDNAVHYKRRVIFNW